VRPQRGERLPHDIEKHSHKRPQNHAPTHPERCAGATFRRGVSIPPNHLIGNTQPGYAKFPAAVGSLDHWEEKKVSWGSVLIVR